MASTITAYGSTGTQIWGLGNNLINTGDLVNMELQALEARKSPMLRQKQTVTNNKQVYSNFKDDFNSLVQAVRKVSSFTGSNKDVAMSSSGSMSVQAGSNAISGSYEVKIDKLATRHQLAGGAFDLTNTVNFNGTVQINGKSLSIDASMTYKQLIDKMNAGDYGVSVYTIHSGTTDSLFMTAKNSGAAGITLTQGATDTFWQSLGFLNADGTASKTITAAQDAAYSINGVALTSASNTIENALPGVTLTLEAVTASPVQLTIGSSNQDEAVAAIQAMTSEYNNAIGKLESYGGEGGALQGSNVILNTSRALASIGSFQAGGAYASSFGIQMDKTGRVTLDTAKLQEAFKKDPEGAKAFFFGANGLGKNIESQLDKVFGETGIIGGKIKSFDEELKKVNAQISKIDDLNRTKQDAIIAKYAKLEQQMSALNTQLNYIKAATKQPSED